MTQRTAIVTGAAGGLGRALAQALIERGSNLVVVDSDSSVEDLTSGRADQVLARVADVTDDSQLTALVADAVDRFGSIDLCINNAGRVDYAPIDLDAAQAADIFESLWRVNTRACYMLGRLVIPHMIEAQHGHLINISTDHVHTCGYPNALPHEDSSSCPWASAPRRPLGGDAFDAYDASKWALNGLTQVWSQALKRHGIRVNNICLGATDTPMIRQAMTDLRGTPPTPVDIAGWMKPDEIADLILELHDEGPSGRTGDNVGIWVGHPVTLPPAHPVLDRSHRVR